MRNRERRTENEASARSVLFLHSRFSVLGSRLLVSLLVSAFALGLAFGDAREADADFLCVRGLHDLGFEPLLQPTLDARLPLRQQRVAQVAQPLGCFAAQAGDVLENQI